MKRGYNTGVATVEFAIVGMIALVLLIGVFESARAIFVYNTLEESTRRAARVAVVCPINDPAIAATALFTNNGGSALVSGLSTDNIAVEYLNGTGTVLGNPTGSYGQIRFVRLRIQNFDHRFLIPLFSTSIRMPGFETTLPRESLGVSREGERAC